MSLMFPYRFEIWLAELPASEDSHVQHGCRPVIVVSNNMANAHSPVVTVVPLTTKIWKNRLPTHRVILASGLRNTSLALCEQVTALDKTRLIHYIGYVSDPEDCAALDRAMAIQIGLAV